VQRLTLPILLATLLVGLVPLGSALAQQTATPIPLVAPPGPVSRFPTRFDVVDAPAHFDQLLLIVDFPAGTWTPAHTPGGYVYTTVIDGEISTRTVGMPEQDTCTAGGGRLLYAGLNSWIAAEPQIAPCPEATYRAGSTFVEKPGEYLQVGNASAATARVISTAMLPIGAPLSVDQEGVIVDAYTALSDGSGPTIVDQASIEVDRPAGAFELVQLVLDFDSGVWTPRHLHGGQELVILTAGGITLQRRGGTEVFTAGESWVNTTGLVHSAGNNGTDFAQAVATFLLPAGRPLTTVM
jgi:quercetin dioxygenase-like cupin family protein